MTLSFSGTVTFSNPYDSDLGHVWRADIPLPDAEFQLFLTRDGYSRYHFGWKQQTTSVEIKEGSIVATGDGYSLVDLRLESGRFPPCQSGSLYSPKAHINGNNIRSAHVDVELVLRSTREIDVPASRRFATFASVGFTKHILNNVCLRFPRSSKLLWANEDFLLKTSSHFQPALSSFAESELGAGTVSTDSELGEYTFEESDDDMDKIDLDKEEKLEVSSQAVVKGESRPAGPPFKTITVTDTAYSTYYAVLVWLQSRYIAFAPLYSTFRSNGQPRSAVAASRSAAISSNVDSSTGPLPLPVSPKSVYRLAHLLELDDLAELALENLKSQLTPSDAAYELYSSVSTCYPAVRDVVLDYAVANWAKVKEAPATKEIQAKAELGDLEPATAGVAMMLASRLRGK